MPTKRDIFAPSRSIKAASIAQIGSKVINVVVQLVITMVLARLLTPEEYGTVAVLTVFSSLFSILADAGVSTAIAQSQDLKWKDYERLFFLSLLIGVALAAGFFVLSFGIAWFYGNAIYIPLGAVLTLAVLFNALNMVPNGILMKERKFTLIAVRLVVCSIVVGCLSILLAFLGFGCYAIVLNAVLTSLFVFLWNLAGAHLKMSAGDVRDVLHKVGRFSAYNLVNSVIYWLASNVDSLIAGKLFGAEALGYYDKAYNLYGRPLNILTVPITNTLLPFLAPLQNDLPALRKRFIGVFRKISFLSALCMALMNACATEVILIMYGDTWAPAIPLLSVLALAMYSRGVNGAFAPLLNACNRPDLLMKSTLINTAITLSFIVAGGIMGSVQSLAACVAMAFNLEMVIPVFFSARYCLEMKVWCFVAHFIPDILAAVIAMLAVHFIPWPSWNVFLALAAKATLVGVIMFATKAATDKIFYRESIIGKLRANRRKSNSAAE